MSDAFIPVRRGMVAQGPPAIVCESHAYAAFVGSDFDRILCPICAREKRAQSWKKECDNEPT